MRWRFEAWHAQHGVERLKERIAPTPKYLVDFVAEGSQRFPFWCVHIQKDERSSSSCLLRPSRAFAVD